MLQFFLRPIRVLSLSAVSLLSMVGSPVMALTSDDSLNSDVVVTEAQSVELPRFATPRMIRNNTLMDTPVIRMGQDDTLIFSFDELRDDPSDLQASLVHCNADWTPSLLSEAEYSDGINIMDIEDHAYSSNTFVRYVNYRIPLPNPDLAPRVSGNYILRIFDRSNPDRTLLEGRFQVSEETARIQGTVSGRTDRGINTEWQQLSLAVDAPEGMNLNPITDLKVTVQQNMRPETLRTLPAPMRVEADRITFEHLPSLIFGAGNEYRRFETVRADYEGMNVERVGLQGRQWHAWPVAGEERASRSHTFDITQHGRYAVDEYSASDPDVGADYIMTHFTLLSEPLYDADVYVEGDLTGRRLDASSRMKYNPQAGAYTLTLPLKQGSYNYQYVVVPRRGGFDDSRQPVEGNHADTTNEYNICVYLRTPGSRADRLVGVQTIYNN